MEEEEEEEPHQKKYKYLSSGDCLPFATGTHSLCSFGPPSRLSDLTLTERRSPYPFEA